MPNPKWRHSKRRKRARRTHYKTEPPQVATCKTTGEPHLLHPYYHEGDLYYRGQVLVPGKQSAESAEA
ncbi:MAG: 50S ribosomal protein L32 [Lewinellaceae bacterium]|nr:50S ribosomal protein L32 [Lewinellaceae bacterium]